MEQSKTRRRPNCVQLAVRLLYVYLVAGILVSILAMPSVLESMQAQTASGSVDEELVLPLIASPGFYVGVLVPTFAVAWFLIYMMGKGHNWARIVFLVLFVLGIPSTGANILRTATSSPTLGLVNIAQVCIVILALVCLFQKSSSDWFSQMKTKKTSACEADALDI